MDHKRPVNLDLSTLKYPPMAIASILHRLSGILLFLLLPLILYFLSLSLKSPEAFACTQQSMANPFNKLALWLFCSAFSYHTLAGIRHVLMDLGFGEHLHTGRRSAITVIFLAILFTILLGIWIW